jgi:bicarbonate transport system ATP-binding protein
MVHPSSMHNLLLRYWLAAGGIHPDREVDLRTIPPAQMVANLQSGSIDGYCVGEPWNLRAAVEGSGFTIATDLEIWLGHPAKVLGAREDWILRYPNAHLALVKALLEACHFADDPANAEQVRAILSQPHYLGTDPAYIELRDSDPTTCRLAEGQRPHAHLQFYGPAANRPSRTEQLWILTQMARWGTVPFPRNWVEVLERVCRVNAFSTAARELGLDVSYSRSPIRLFDGTACDAEDPIGYLNRLPIRGEVYIADVAL